MANEKILVVDDDRQIARLVEFNLQRHGYAVTTAHDGVQALEKVAQDKPDLIILDIMMPRLDGWEVMNRLQSSMETMNIPVIFLTAQTSDAAVAAGWRSGASCYLTKPFNPDEMLLMVKRLLEGTGASTSSAQTGG